MTDTSQYGRQPAAPKGTRLRRKEWLWIVGGAVALAVLFMIGATLLVNTKTPSAANPDTSSPSSPSIPAAQIASEPTLPMPTAGDYSVDLTVASKHCFGSAGCNVQVEPKLNLLGAGTLFWDCDITYSISGDTSGELVETAYAEGDARYRVDQTSVRTKNSKVVPKATVTSVSCRKP